MRFSVVNILQMQKHTNHNEAELYQADSAADHSLMAEIYRQRYHLVELC